MLLAKSIGGRALAAAILLGTALSPHQAFAEKTNCLLASAPPMLELLTLTSHPALRTVRW